MLNNNLPSKQWQEQTESLLTTTFRDALPPLWKHLVTSLSQISTLQTLGWVGANLTNLLFPGYFLPLFCRFSWTLNICQIDYFSVSRHNLPASITAFENYIIIPYCAYVIVLESKCLMTKDQILVTFSYLKFNNYPPEFKYSIVQICSLFKA